MQTKLYSQITDALVEDGYIIIENSLNSPLASSLKNYSLNETDFKRAGISGASDLHLDNTRRRDKIHWLEHDTKVQSEFLNFADGLREYLNCELYLGLSYYESHFAIYDEGDFYEKHYDSFKNFKNRVVTTVYFLNEEWGDEDGGELIVYDAKDNFLAKVQPKADTLVVFMSERFPHEVLPTKKKRYSIAGWFRVDK